MITPIVEFAEIDKPSGAKTIFDERLYGEHGYWGPIIRQLQKATGIYVFFDSRAVALYVGKADGQSIWQRANQSLNDDRDTAVGILLASHPTTNVSHKPHRHNVLKIEEYPTPLIEAAQYFSAYDVADNLIDTVEALLIRTHCNTLLNIQRGGKKSLGTFKETATRET